MTQISDLTAQITSDAAAIDAAAAQQASDLAAANAKIAQLSAASHKCVYGSSIATGSLAATDTKFGRTVPALRVFWSGALGTTVPGAGRFIVGSFKTMPPPAATLHQLTYWTFQHEIDAKIKKGQYDLASWKTNMLTLSKLGIPGLCVILTADCFVNSSKNPDDYLGWARDTIGVTHFGADFDGISYPDHYHDYSKETAAVHAYAAKYNMTWGVPETGANQAANDTDGVVRAAWAAKTTADLSAAGAQYQLLFEWDGQAGSEFKTPAEVATWRALFGA